MQPNGSDQNWGMPPYQPYTPEQMQQWQQYGIPQQQFTPEILQFMQQQGISPQQVTPQMLEQWQFQFYQQQQMQQMQQMQQIQQMQQMQAMDLPPSARKQKRQRSPSRERRGGGGLGRILRFLLILVVIGGGAWFLWNSNKGSAPTTATIEMGTLGTIYRGDALIVREETVFQDEGVQSIEYVAQEGSVVYPGNVVCYVYSTGYSSKEMTALQSYRDQIKSYQLTLLKSETAYDPTMEELENKVIKQGLQVRNLVQGEHGNLINQEIILATAITQRQNKFRSKYASDMRLSRLYDDEETQQQRIDSWIKQHHASRGSIVSFYADGFEQALAPDPDSLGKYTPSEVRAMINGQKPEVSTAARGRTNIYRLVTEQNYAVLMLIKDNTWNPVEGSTHKLKLEQFANTVVDTQILSFTRSGGELLLRLKVIGDVTPVLYMRTCQAELGEYADCMLVPTTAIYTQSGVKGVVVISGEQQLFVPVNVVQESGGNAYISAIQTGVLSAGQTVRLF